MKRDDLIRALRRHARKHGISFVSDKAGGKGGHYRLRIGERVTTVQSGALSPFHVRRICQQLEIDAAEL